jgi:hypothetical protein
MRAGISIAQRSFNSQTEESPMTRVIFILLAVPSLALAAGTKAKIAADLRETPGAKGFHLKFDGRRIHLGKEVPAGTEFRTTTAMETDGLLLKKGKYNVTGVYNAKYEGSGVSPMSDLRLHPAR